MEKITFENVVYYVNEAMNRGYDLKATTWKDDFSIESDKIELTLHPEGNCIIITKYNDNHYSYARLNSLNFEITDLEKSKFLVLWEEVKNYSQDKLTYEFFNLLNNEDNCEKTVDDIDD